MGKRIVITDLPFQLDGRWESCSGHLVIHGNGTITDVKGHNIGKCVEEHEIIQCKDCKYYKPLSHVLELGYCLRHGNKPYISCVAINFCSWAEPYREESNDENHIH